MTANKTLQLLTAVVILAAALLFLTKNSWLPPLREWWTSEIRHVSELTPPVLAPDSTVGKTFGVTHVQVLRGDQFDLVLDNESRLLARLNVSAAEEAKKQVVDLLNHCENPQVRLLEKQTDGKWLIAFTFQQNGKEVDLARWLADNKLVYTK